MQITLTLTLDEIATLRQAIIYSKPILEKVNEIPAIEINNIAQQLDAHLAHANPILYDIAYAADYFDNNRG